VRIRLGARKWTGIDESVGDTTGHQGPLGWQGSGSESIPNRVLRHLPKRAILTEVFNAVLRWQYVPSAWKHARVVPILKPVKDPTLPSSYRHISLFNTLGKFCVKVLPSRVLREVNEPGMLSHEQFRFWPRHSTTLQLVRFLGGVKRSCDEKRLTGAPLLDVAKAFDIMGLKGLLYKRTFLNFPSYLVKTASLCLDCRTFQTSFQSATSTRRVMGAYVARGGLVSSVLFSLCVNDIHTPASSRSCTRTMELLSSSCSPSVLIEYLEACLRRLDLWLRV
jgi:hypothetical protein